MSRTILYLLREPHVMGDPWIFGRIGKANRSSDGHTGAGADGGSRVTRTSIRGNSQSPRPPEIACDQWNHW